MHILLTQSYFIQGEKQWLLDSLKKCSTCKMLSSKVYVPSSAALLPKGKNKVWQIDYIGAFPPDTQTGHW